MSASQKRASTHQEGHDGLVRDAARLVFADGDRVTGSGRIVEDHDGVWLDLARFIPAIGLAHPLPRSRLSVRLERADLVAVPAEAGAPGRRATVVGTWVGAAIQVETFGPFRPDDPDRPSWTVPPCPAPKEGWPGTGRIEAPPAVAHDLLDSGAAVSLVIFRPSAEQTVIVVAATDAAQAERVLRPQLGARLCVVPSRWTRRQLDEVQRWFRDRGRESGVETVGEYVDEQAQASVQVRLLRVTAEVVRWADGLPDGLLRLEQALRPVSHVSGS